MVWQSIATSSSVTSLASPGIQRKRESSTKGQHCCSDWVTFWMTLLSDSSLSQCLGTLMPVHLKSRGSCTAQSEREEEMAEHPTRLSGGQPENSSPKVHTQAQTYLTNEWVNRVWGWWGPSHTFHPFIYSCNKNLLTTFYVHDTVHELWTTQR